MTNTVQMNLLTRYSGVFPVLLKALERISAIIKGQKSQSRHKEPKVGVCLGEIIHVNTRNCHQILKLHYQRRQTIDSVETKLQTSATSTEMSGNQQCTMSIPLDLSLLCICISLNKVSISFQAFWKRLSMKAIWFAPFSFGEVIKNGMEEENLAF